MLRASTFQTYVYTYNYLICIDGIREGAASVNNLYEFTVSLYVSNKYNLF